MEEDKKIQKNFSTYNLRIGKNTPYPMFLIKSIISPIEIMTMIRYLMYKKRIKNMEDKRFSKIASNCNQHHHLHLK